jgi:hypothetical protein
VNVLVDTSIWVAHFKERDEHLVSLLLGAVVACHPFVVLEMACAAPPQRSNIIRMLADLESATVATHDEVLDLIDRHSLYGKGCGLVDLSLLASTLLSPNTQLWTSDTRLAKLAAELGCAYMPNLQH